MLGIAALVGAAGWLAGGALSSLGERPAVLELDRTRIDFGTVTGGPELSGTFIVRNAGARRLILRERGGCNCLGERRSEVIPPGQSVEVHGRLPTRGRFGPVRRELQFASSDPRRPVVTLVLQAVVEPAER